MSTLPSRVAGGVEGLTTRFSRWMQALRQALALYRSRQDLRDLSDAQLLDIGVTRDEAAAEARRGFHRL